MRTPPILPVTRSRHKRPSADPHAKNSAPGIASSSSGCSRSAGCRRPRRRCRARRPALLHHQHVVGDQAHHGEVVGDEQVGQPEVALQVGEQVAGSAPGRARRARTPPRRRPPAAGRAPAPGRSPRAAAGRRTARRDGAGRPRRAARPGRAARPTRRRPRGAVADPEDPQRLVDDVLDRERGVERAVRVLEHRLHRPADRAAPRRSRSSTSTRRPRTSPAVGRLEAEHDPRDGRLAGARLADHRGGGAPGP